MDFKKRKKYLNIIFSWRKSFEYNYYNSHLLFSALYFARSLSSPLISRKSLIHTDCYKNIPILLLSYTIKIKKNYNLNESLKNLNMIKGDK